MSLSPLLTGVTGCTVTTTSLRCAFQVACRAVGLGEFGYGLHSLRSGGASLAASLGVSLEDIRSHGLWAPDSIHVVRYTRLAPLLNSPTATAFRNM